jgi:hypothetical protein
MPNHRSSSSARSCSTRFNHANFGPPNLQRESSGFGQILTAATARIVQFGLKFYF